MIGETVMGEEPMKIVSKMKGQWGWSGDRRLEGGLGDIKNFFDKSATRKKDNWKKMANEKW